ncbi:MAG: hypothetical protein H0X64_02305 [Gemmatimonadaceae bacterium]|nr:hypothetical protein [Gemmatimonadaceae bacterium]
MSLPVSAAPLASLATLLCGLVAFPASAQRPLHNTAVASIQLVAIVPAVLEFTSVAVTATTSGPAQSHVTSQVTVRANVPHRVRVRLAAPGAPGSRTEVLSLQDRWVPIDSDTWVAVAATPSLGERTHDVQCRTSQPAGVPEQVPVGCRLAYDLESQRASSPVNMATTAAGTATIHDPIMMSASNAP